MQGLSSEEILSACDENVVSGDRMTNPAIHFFRGLRHRNLAAIRHAAQRGLHQLHQPHHPSPQHVVDGSEIQRSRAQPLIIQGLRTNPKDQDSHVLFFDIEALVGKIFICYIFSASKILKEVELMKFVMLYEYKLRYAYI